MSRLFVFLVVLVMVNSDQKNYEKAREYMVNSQIKARGVKSSVVLNALLKVPRHKFVPKRQVKFAYTDNPLPIGYGQTISQPYIVAYMTEILGLEKHHKVLEIGTGSGYQAAVLSEIVDSVYTIEIVRPLGLRAGEVLSNLNYNNVSTKVGDGYYGWVEKGPFDAIMVTAAAEFIPPPLIQQLKNGGKMIIPVGAPFFVQQLVLVEKRKGKTKTKNLMAVRFVPLTRSGAN